MALKEFLQHSKESRGVLGQASRQRGGAFKGRKEEKQKDEKTQRTQKSFKKKQKNNHD